MQITVKYTVLKASVVENNFDRAMHKVEIE